MITGNPFSKTDQGGLKRPSYLQQTSVNNVGVRKPIFGQRAETPQRSMINFSGQRPFAQPLQRAATMARQGIPNPQGTWQALAQRKQQPQFSPPGHFNPVPQQPVLQQPQQPENPNSIKNLQSIIEQNIGKTRFDLPAADSIFKHFSRNLEDTAKLKGSDAIADASRRGVYYGTPLTTSLGNIDTELQRGKADLATNVLFSAAQTGMQDNQLGIDNAFRFGELARSGELQDREFAALMAQLGMAGELTPGQALASYGPIQQPQGSSLDPAIFAQLGSLFGGQQKPATTAPQGKNPFVSGPLPDPKKRTTNTYQF